MRRNETEVQKFLTDARSLTIGILKVSKLNGPQPNARDVSLAIFSLLQVLKSLKNCYPSLHFRAKDFFLSLQENDGGKDDEF